MANSKVLHILFPEKFFNDYVQFINENFNPEDHLFLYLKTNGKEPKAENVKRLRFYRFAPLFYWEMCQYMNQADKVFLHSLSKTKVIFFLFLFPRYAKKCYWLLWGGDLYYRISKSKKPPFYNLGNLYFSRVVKNLGHVITHVKGDVELARRMFGFKGRFHECLLYPSNLFGTTLTNIKKDKSLNILLGNSADPSNNHFEVIDRIEYLKETDIKVICPLSYGKPKNAEKVNAYGVEKLGDKFVPLTKFIPFTEYKEILENIDIAIFNHWRQQGIGNIITLLGMGKTVYIRSEITTWDMLKEKNITVLDFTNAKTISQITEKQRINNIEIIKNYFNKETLKIQHENIFSNNPTE